MERHSSFKFLCSTNLILYVLHSDSSYMMDQGSSGAGEGFEVTKFGHGRVALIGFPRLDPLITLELYMLERK